MNTKVEIMKKNNKNEKLILFCPRCGSKDVLLPGIGVAAQSYDTYNCKSCGYYSKAYPELPETEYKLYLKQLKTKPFKENDNLKNEPIPKTLAWAILIILFIVFLGAIFESTPNWIVISLYGILIVGIIIYLISKYIKIKKQKR
jgi:ribosomal protein S27AE